MIKITKNGKEVIYNDNNTLIEDAAEFMEQYGVEFEDAMMKFNCMDELEAVKVAVKVFEEQEFAEEFAAKIRGRRMKYKSVEELKKMSLEEVAEYVDQLERTDEGAKNNSFEYQEWCGNELSERLADVSLEEWTEMLRKVSESTNQ